MLGNAVQSGFDYSYDAAGNVAQLTRLLSRASATDPQIYTYDSASRLTALSRTGAGTGLAHSLAWDLDGLGNWNSVKKDGEAIGDLRRDDSWNATISRTEPSENLVYDANGNLTADGQHQFVWDAFGRLYQVKDANGTLIATYRYDALGRRVRKYLYAGNIEIDAVWDGWRLIEEHEGPIGGATADAAARWFVYGNGIDEPLMMHVKGDIPAHDKDYYYHQDALGSVAALTDATGSVAERYEYDPYGAHVRIVAAPTPTPMPAPNAPSTLGNPFLYAGRQFDAESGLYYNRHRYYDPDLGRFISTDPISYHGGINLYEYTGSQPINCVDPLGLDWIDPPSIERRGGLFANPAINFGLTHGDKIAVGVVVYGAKNTKDYVWKHPLKAMANIASFFCEPVDWVNSGHDAYGELRTGHPIVAAVTMGGALLPVVTGKMARSLINGAEEAKDLARAGEKVEEVTKDAEKGVCEAAQAGADVKNLQLTGKGYGVTDPPVRIEGAWSEEDYMDALWGNSPAGLGNPELHHAGQMPGSGIHEINPNIHRSTALHPNKYNQGVTNLMRNQDRQLHWWYRAQEMGACELYPDLIYDNLIEKVLNK